MPMITSKLIPAASLDHVPSCSIISHCAQATPPAGEFQDEISQLQYPPKVQKCQFHHPRPNRIGLKILVHEKLNSLDPTLQTKVTNSTLGSSTCFPCSTLRIPWFFGSRRIPPVAHVIGSLQQLHGIFIFHGSTIEGRDAHA